ncbi:MAG: glycosyltransferase [Clostridiales bacterium]|nr:glycosyltransferase [Clostridiales bacterium]
MDEIRDLVAQRPEYDYEIVAVNDCSPDNVLSVLRQQAAQDRRVKVIDLAKNGGRHNALMCGCHYTTGDYVAFIDDDLQCPTDRFWDLLAPLESGDYDVSIAKYPKKTQSGLKNFGSKVNDTVANWLLGKDKDLKFSNYSVMRRFVKDEVIRYTNPYPYLSGLMLRATSRVTNVVMEERERTIGVGHYNFKKSFALWMNSFTAFSVKPLRLATTLGVICAFVGVITGIYTVIHKFLVPTVAVGYSSLMAAMLFLGGMIMFLLGLIGEYIGRIYISLNNSPQYVVRETLNVEEASVR